MLMFTIKSTIGFASVHIMVHMRHAYEHTSHIYYLDGKKSAAQYNNQFLWVHILGHTLRTCAI